ncbi:MAG: transglycosylase SLT domain-containing protein, partial [Calditrichia bacterium]|nr:transglycosylase SLT domain-containing protein [Calditrichia bacterium]
MRKFNLNIFIVLLGLLFFIILLEQVRWEHSVNENGNANSEPDSLLLTLVEKIENKQKLSLIKKRILKRHIQKKIAIYEPVITKFSKRYGLDWRLIVAQILKESRFSEHSVSYMGAKGLMQIMPRTAKEISRELRLSGIRINPRANIIGGIYHMSKQLRFYKRADQENRVRFALASYNCGAGHVFDAQDISEYQKLNSQHWENIRPNLKKLKKRNFPLHLKVWANGKPPYGYFIDHKQTINYVDDIMDYYEML